MLITDHMVIRFGPPVQPTCLLRTTRLLGTPEKPNKAEQKFLIQVQF